MAENLNAAELAAVELTSSQIDLNRLTLTTRARVVSTLRVLETDLVRQLRAADLAGLSSESLKRRRLEKLLRETRTVIAGRYSTAATQSARGALEAATFMQGEAVSVLNGLFRVNIVAPTLTRSELRALVDRDVVLGEPARDWWNGQAEGTRRRFAREMRLGIQQGETNEELIRRVRGRSTGRTIEITTPRGRTKRVREFTGGAMDVSRNQAETLVRTSAQSVGNRAAMNVYEENGDLIKGYEAVTTLDGRTSRICMARTGSAWYVNGEPFPTSATQEGFPGPPPWHFKCRTQLSPVTYSWDELIERASGRRLDKLNTVPDSARATMDGQIGSGRVRTFDDWLNIKGDEFARNKLGPELFDAWKEGQITLSQLIDSGGNLVPVKQLLN